MRDRDRAERLMPTMLDLAWLGGRTGARQRRRRPGLDDLPWAPIDAAPEVRREAQAVWSHAAFLEFASAAAFAALASALLEAAAPIDLIAEVSDIVVDELDHVEATCRLVMALGGAAPVAFDLAQIAPRPTADRSPRFRAAELALTSSCIGENLSLPALGRSRQTARAPLVAAVLDRIVADEGGHAMVGFEVLGWAAPGLSEPELAELAEVALTTLRACAPLWSAEACAACPPPIGLGGHDDVTRVRLRRAVRTRIARPLARCGVILDEAALRSVGA
jgi:hypothetical protein